MRFAFGFWGLCFELDRYNMFLLSVILLHFKFCCFCFGFDVSVSVSAILVFCVLRFGRFGFCVLRGAFLRLCFKLRSVLALYNTYCVLRLRFETRSFHI